mmetsp:Transcript_101115/g.123809  ORF Transcript_101115/g.123809 Transcript_101115/m.123809 type:complete len:84 (-) Transcript_101115:166-417(-)
MAPRSNYIIKYYMPSIDPIPNATNNAQIKTIMAEQANNGRAPTHDIFPNVNIKYINIIHIAAANNGKSCNNTRNVSSSNARSE